MNTLEGLRAGEYAGAKKIKIPSGLTSFPLELLDLAPTLEILDLSGNALSILPASFNRLQNLKILFLSDCKFATFPAELSSCPALEMIAFKGNGMTIIPANAFPPNLRWLILTNNKIEALPRSIGRCPRLQKCMLAGNNLKSLPSEMANCKKLGLLRISANKIEELPDWLLEMPELSFLAFAGNPCAPSFEDNPVLEDIAWTELSVTTLLGEGASGIISKSVWKQGNRDCAVKLFKGEVTSDGSPADEMAACITAGKHSNLIDPWGKIHGHPDKRGLVLQLIPPHFGNLGNPPTLNSCTRDNYPSTLVGTFSTGKAIRILRGIASAATHLHERGISHGDLYAHNILVDADGHALLGDFGAASIYHRSHARAEALEKLEVLAFGHLLEDMTGLIGAGHQDKSSHAAAEAVRALKELHGQCILPVVKERPLFVDIDKTLQGIDAALGKI